MKLKRNLGIVAAIVVAAGAVVYHLLFGFGTVLQVADNVMVVQRSSVLGQVGANVVVYNAPDRTVVVDTQLRPLARMVRGDVEALSDSPITDVVITHWHPDHSGGIAAWSADTRVIAHAAVSGRLSSVQEGYGLTKPGSYHRFEPRESAGLPGETIDSEKSVETAAGAVRVIHLAHAHTDGDVTVFLADSRVVAVGDLIWPGSFPFVDVHNGGTVAGLERALQRIIDETGAKYRFVPGHGAILSYEDVVRYRAMVSDSRDWVEVRLRRGESPEQLAEAGLPPEWDRWASRLVPGPAWIQMIADSMAPADAI